MISRLTYRTQSCRILNIRRLSTKNLAQAAPSSFLCRLDEFYDQVLAEDLMILSYDHRYFSRNSKYARVILQDNVDNNADFLKTVAQIQRDKLDEEVANLETGADASAEAYRRQHASKVGKTVTSAMAVKEFFEKKKTIRDDSYRNYLDPRDLVAKKEVHNDHPAHYDNLSRINRISIKMPMTHAVTHSKKVLYNGLMALQLITGQQPRVIQSTVPDSRLRIRKNMPIGVQVDLAENERLMFQFLEKWVEVVLPRVRDFKGFSKASGCVPSYGLSSETSLIAKQPLLTNLGWKLTKPILSNRQIDIMKTYRNALLPSFVSSLYEMIGEKPVSYLSYLKNGASDSKKKKKERKENKRYTFVSSIITDPKLYKPDDKPVDENLDSGARVLLRMDAESWQAFPEIEESYLKFPSPGSIGSLQDYEIEFYTSARTEEEARLLLSGYRIPFTYLESVEPNEPAHGEETIYEI